MLWTAADLALATGGTARVPFAASGVSIDSRTLQPGDLFVALTDARDGHEFVADALARGAAGALIRRGALNLPPDAPVLEVADPLASLRDLARFARARFTGRVVAVTGSVGKTTTKEMLRAVLGGLGRVHAADASFNNHIGVPLTLARMPPEADYAVIEIGMNHPGEIAPLAGLAQPNVAIVTNVAAAHIGHMGSLEAIAREKSAIFQGLRPGGAAVLGLRSQADLIVERAAHDATENVWLAVEGGRVETLSSSLDPDGSDLFVRVNDQEFALRLGAPGLHMAENALKVLAAVAALGGDPALAAQGLADFSAAAGRGVRRSILGGKALLLDESYNASTLSVRATLALLDLVHAERRIAVLGDMREMGEFGPSEHASLAADVRQHADLLFTCGPLMGHLHEAVLSAPSRDSVPASVAVMHAEDAEHLAPLVASAIRPGDAVLVKGSFGSRMRLVVDALTALPEAV